MIRYFFAIVFALICMYLSPSASANACSEKVTVIVDRGSNYSKNDLRLQNAVVVDYVYALFKGVKPPNAISVQSIFPDTSQALLSVQCPPTIYIGNIARANDYYGTNLLVLAQQIQDHEAVIAVPRNSNFLSLDDIERASLLLSVPMSSETSYVVNPLIVSGQVGKGAAGKVAFIASALTGLEALTATSMESKNPVFGNLFLLGKYSKLDPHRMGIVTNKSFVEYYNAKLRSEKKDFATFRILSHPKFTGPGVSVFSSKDIDPQIRDGVVRNAMTLTGTYSDLPVGFTARKENLDTQLKLHTTVHPQF